MFRSIPTIALFALALVFGGCTDLGNLPFEACSSGDDCSVLEVCNFVPSPEQLEGCREVANSEGFCVSRSSLEEAATNGETQSDARRALACSAPGRMDVGLDLDATYNNPWSNEDVFDFDGSMDAATDGSSYEGSGTDGGMVSDSGSGDAEVEDGSEDSGVALCPGVEPCQGFDFTDECKAKLNRTACSDIDPDYEWCSLDGEIFSVLEIPDHCVAQ